MTNHVLGIGSLPVTKAQLLVKGLTLGLCLRCSIRMTGYGAEGVYGLPNEELAALALGVCDQLASTLGETAVSSFHVSSATCPACLGMLQRAPDLAADLIKAQQASPYVQPSQFSFALGMPKATIVRNAAAILAVLEPPDEPHSLLWSIVREVFDLKDAIQ
eukprot:EG_transcript_39176